MNDIHNCAARALREWGQDTDLIILTSEDDLADARNAIGVTLPGVESIAGVWDTGKGKVSLRKFQDTPDNEPGRLVVCTGGKPLSSGASTGLRRWREATASV